jgi:hypothetical protein
MLAMSRRAPCIQRGGSRGRLRPGSPATRVARVCRSGHCTPRSSSWTTLLRLLAGGFSRALLTERLAQPRAARASTVMPWALVGGDAGRRRLEERGPEERRPEQQSALPPRSRRSACQHGGSCAAVATSEAQPSRLAPGLPCRRGCGLLFGAGGDCSTKTSPLQNSTEQELRPVSRMRRHRSAKF